MMAIAAAIATIPTAARLRQAAAAIAAIVALRLALAPMLRQAMALCLVAVKPTERL